MYKKALYTEARKPNAAKAVEGCRGEFDELVRCCGLLTPIDQRIWANRRAAMLADVQLRIAAHLFEVEIPASKPGARHGRPNLLGYLAQHRTGRRTGPTITRYVERRRENAA